MKKFINHIRKQPEHTRRHILHVLTLMCAFILLSLWVYSLGNSFGDPDAKVEASKGSQPFSVLKDNFSSLW